MTEIFNWAIRETTFVFRKVEATVAEREEHFRSVEGYPYLVVETDRVMGFALLQPHNDPRRWDGCFEDSIYIDPAGHGQGLGKHLLSALVEEARQDERIHTVLALICGNNPASVALHEKLGFKKSGYLRELSFKHGQWLDLNYLQLMV
ncbi:hypothetical protein CPHO_08700 [Corynebacterium phocae]|uniref:N-acetyltransferase domain-containing protein n=2 Tax=Corynebacterium phocae TaxID=161895 RepID=A0A1L7D6G4_9CORY|nr:hypothetical protein CPHO_08700 [Corynebacterium phocae]